MKNLMRATVALSIIILGTMMSFTVGEPVASLFFVLAAGFYLRSESL